MFVTMLIFVFKGKFYIFKCMYMFLNVLTNFVILCICRLLLYMDSFLHVIVDSILFILNKWFIFHCYA